MHKAVDPDPRIPKELRDLMINSNISEQDIMNIVGEKGFFPADMPVWEYPHDAPDNDFIGYLLSVWSQIIETVRKSYEEIPFNA